MERTVDFYTNVLGMKLKKGFDLDHGYGQHFFFDMGGGNDLAFSGSAMRSHASRPSAAPAPWSGASPATSPRLTVP
jgi:catechol 2,3-dioxygenase-like lactoylglutathione lyase family enzyme